MKFALGSDHAGWPLKEKFKEWLTLHGHEVVDFGTHDATPCDYPDFVLPAARAVARGMAERGVVFGGSGNGEAMAANKIRGIRCGLCFTTELARLNRAHNDGNMLSLGARLISLELALDILRVWIETPFEGGRHLARLAKVDILGSN
jgi:ribose 5-phosphate isomerase B